MAEGTTTESTRSRAASAEPTTDQADQADAAGGAAESGQPRVEGQPPVATTTGSNGKPVPANPSEPGRGTVPEPSTPSTVGKAGKRSRASRVDQDSKDGKDSRLAKSGKAVKKGSDLIRSRIASLVWLVCLLAAIVLAGGALLFALDANMQNDLVKAVIDLAHKLDGPFWRVFEFHSDTKGPGPGPHDATKEHLVNWGLAAVAWLVVGRVLDRVIRP